VNLTSKTSLMAKWRPKDRTKMGTSDLMELTIQRASKCDWAKSMTVELSGNIGGRS
jgi:hypothetical protein